MKSLIIPIAVAVCLSACDARVTNPPSEKVIEKNTTIITPPAKEDKVENKTIIVNPPATEKKTTTTTTEK